MTRSFPHLGFDPTPGDVERTRALSRQLGDLHGELTTTVAELARLDTGTWKGEAAKAFVTHIDHDVTPLIKKAHDSFGRASTALSHWADQLHTFQTEADALEREAATKQTTLDNVRQRAHELHTRFTDAATTISHDLDKAGDIAPDKPGLFHRITHGIENAWNDTVQWVKDHADLIKLIGDLLSDLTGILGVLAILTAPFEPVGALFAGAAVVAGTLALTAHVLAKLAGADVSWMQLGLDALGVLPGIGLFGKGVKIARVADEGVMASKAAAFGKGFTATVVEGRKAVSLGAQAASEVEGGIRVKNVVLFGSKEFSLISKPGSGLASRLANVSNSAYHQGQWMGTRGIRVLTLNKLRINPLSELSTGLDAGLKLIPKVISIPQHAGEAVHPGDRFHEAAEAT